MEKEKTLRCNLHNIPLTNYGYMEESNLGYTPPDNTSWTDNYICDECSKQWDI